MHCLLCNFFFVSMLTIRTKVSVFSVSALRRVNGLHWLSVWMFLCTVTQVWTCTPMQIFGCLLQSLALIIPLVCFVPKHTLDLMFLRTLVTCTDWVQYFRCVSWCVLFFCLLSKNELNWCFWCLLQHPRVLRLLKYPAEDSENPPQVMSLFAEGVEGLSLHFWEPEKHAHCWVYFLSLALALRERM